MAHFKAQLQPIRPESPEDEFPEPESLAPESSAPEYSAFESSALEFSALESSASESSALESPAPECPELESLELESPDLESPELQSPELESPGLESPEFEWDPRDWESPGLKCDCGSAQNRVMEYVYVCSDCYELSDSELARFPWGWEGTLDVPVQCSECEDMTTAADAQWYCRCCTEPCIKVVHFPQRMEQLP